MPLTNKEGLLIFINGIMNKINISEDQKFLMGTMLESQIDTMTNDQFEQIKHHAIDFLDRNKKDIKPNAFQ